jgi:hypothetical protein
LPIDHQSTGNFLAVFALIFELAPQGSAAWGADFDFAVLCFR